MLKDPNVTDFLVVRTLGTNIQQIFCLNLLISPCLWRYNLITKKIMYHGTRARVRDSTERPLASAILTFISFVQYLYSAYTKISCKVCQAWKRGQDKIVYTTSPKHGKQTKSKLFMETFYVKHLIQSSSSHKCWRSDYGKTQQGHTTGK